MKTFRILGLALVVTGLLFAGCKKTEEEDEEDEGTAISLDVSAPETASNKNALVEEFTGTNCGYCPDGHKRVNELIAANPGKVFAINIHTGRLAAKYTTSFGAALAEQSWLTGYPAGTVNRHEFEGWQEDTNRTHQNRTALNRGYFQAAANQIMAQPACANIAAKATINKSTREVTVGVAVYYTGTPTGSTNMINVAITEDSIWGPQSENASASNPAQWNSDHTLYCHTHMLRHLITGQWGDEITPVVGKQIKKEYKYTLPQTISNETVVPEHLHIIAFLCEGHHEVINVCSAPITFK